MRPRPLIIPPQHKSPVRRKKKNSCLQPCRWKAALLNRLPAPCLMSLLISRLPISVLIPGHVTITARPSILMGNGTPRKNTARCGSLRRQAIIRAGLHTPMAAGTLLILAGTSLQAIHGAGHATTTGDGSATMISDGAGFPGGNGRQPGSHGVSRTATSDGVHCRHQQPGPTGQE